MSTVTLADLVKPKDKAAISTLQLDVLRTIGVPVTTWQTGSPLRSLVDADAEAMADLWEVVASIATGGFLNTATGAWLDLLVEGNWDDARKPAIAAERAITLRNSTGVGITFDDEDYLVQTTGGLLFRSAAPVAGGSPPYTVPANGTLDVVFVAESPGAAYNAATSSWSFVTSVPGLSVNGEAVWADAVSGADEETDDELRARVKAKLGKLSAGGNALFYMSHALDASNEIRRVRVRERHPLPGQVSIYLAGASGPVSSTAVDAVQDLLRPSTHDGIAPLCVDVFVHSVTNNTIVISGTVYALAAELDAAKVAFETNLERLRLGLRPGAKISRERIIATIMSTLSSDDKNDLSLVFPSSDVQLASSEVARFNTADLEWQPVT